MSAVMNLAGPREVRPPQDHTQEQCESANSALEEQLRAALSGGHYVPYDGRIRADCFLLGALCAKAELQLPDWLNSAALWAHEAALRGYFAFWNRRASGLEMNTAECVTTASTDPLTRPACAIAELHLISRS